MGHVSLLTTTADYQMVLNTKFPMNLLLTKYDLYYDASVNNEPNMGKAFIFTSDSLICCRIYVS